jgi:hypothetical protein
MTAFRKRLESEFMEIVAENNMSRENAKREADRLQTLRGLCQSSDGCMCPRFIISEDSTRCQHCGDEATEHPFRAPADFYRPLFDSMAFPHDRGPNELTVYIHAHGCDIPLPTFHDIPLADQQPMFERTLILSSVSHSCLHYGDSQQYLTSLQKVYRDHTKSQAEQLTEFQRISQAESIALQRQPAKLTADPLYAAHRDNFLSARPEQLFRIHRPVVEREYNFSRTAKDIAEGKQFGIYIVASSKPDDDIIYSYRDQYRYEQDDPVSPFSQQNNLLSPTLSPSLQKYKNYLENLLQTQVLDIVRLSNILYTLFQVAQPVAMIRVIDIGCRITCDGYDGGAAAVLQRIPSASIDSGEERLGALVRKRRVRKSKARKSKVRKSKQSKVRKARNVRKSKQ